MELIQKNIVFPLASPIKQISSFQSKTLLFLENEDILLLDINEQGVPYLILKQNIRKSVKVNFDQNYKVLNQMDSFNKEQKLEQNMIEYLLENKAFAESEKDVKKDKEEPLIKPDPEQLD